MKKNNYVDLFNFIHFKLNESLKNKRNENIKGGRRLCM